jgi:hypothetical protein
MPVLIVARTPEGAHRQRHRGHQVLRLLGGSVGAAVVAAVLAAHTPAAGVARRVRLRGRRARRRDGRAAVGDLRLGLVPPVRRDGRAPGRVDGPDPLSVEKLRELG